MEIVLIILGFFIGFPLLWCGVLMLISALSGWGTLANHYAVAEMPKGKRRTTRSMQIRRFRFIPGNYSNVMIVAVDQNALYIAPMFMFRPFHTPLRLPFEDITLDRSPRGFRMPFFKVSDLMMAREPSIKITMLDKDVNWIEEVHGRLPDTPS